MSKFFIVIVSGLALILVSAACGSIPFVAQNEPTATATRRVRPTFTPKPSPTQTVEVTPTDIPTETVQATETTAATSTPKPVTSAPRNPPAPRPQATTPPQPPKPQFSINATSTYLCEQQGIYEVILNAKRGRAFAGGLVFGAFDAGGRLLQDGAGKNLIGTTQSDISISIGSNCRVEADFTSPNSSNGKLDVGDAVRAGTNPIIIKFIKSATDFTPLSPDIPVNFGKGGQYWMYIQAQ